VEGTVGGFDRVIEAVEGVTEVGRRCGRWVRRDK
jgi:hypothetical protein